VPGTGPRRTLALVLSLAFAFAEMSVGAFCDEQPLTLKASMSSDKAMEFSAQTTQVKMVHLAERVISDRVSNHNLNDAFLFRWTAEGRLFAGILPPAARMGNEVIPRTLTQKWNTFRSVEEGNGQIELKAKLGGVSEITAQRWLAAKAEPRRAAPGGKLYAMLIESEGKGRVPLG
jgi:hypothetical protein